MPRYTVTDPQTGQRLTLERDTAPSEQELDALFSAQAPAPVAPAAQPPPRVAMEPEENPLQYWSRSPLVQDVGAAVGEGARRVRGAAGEAVSDLMTAGSVASLPVDLPVAAAAALGRYAWRTGVQEPLEAIGERAGRLYRRYAPVAKQWFQNYVLPPPQVRPEGKTHVRSPDGKTGWIPTEQLPLATSQGYQVID